MRIKCWGYSFDIVGFFSYVNWVHPWSRMATLSPWPFPFCRRLADHQYPGAVVVNHRLSRVLAICMHRCNITLKRYFVDELADNTPRCCFVLTTRRYPSVELSCIDIYDGNRKNSRVSVGILNEYCIRHFFVWNNRPQLLSKGACSSKRYE